MCAWVAKEKKIHACERISERKRLCKRRFMFLYLPVRIYIFTSKHIYDKGEKERDKESQYESQTDRQTY